MTRMLPEYVLKFNMMNVALTDLTNLLNQYID